MADFKISQLPVADEAVTGDFLVINKGNTTTSRMDVKDFVDDFLVDNYVTLNGDATPQVISGTGGLTIGALNSGLIKANEGVSALGGTDIGIVSGLRGSTNFVGLTANSNTVLGIQYMDDRELASINSDLSAGIALKIGGKTPDTSCVGVRVVTDVTSSNTSLVSFDVNPNYVDGSNLTSATHYQAVLSQVSMPNLLTQKALGINFGYESASAVNNYGVFSLLSENSDENKNNWFIYSAGTARSWVKGSFTVGGTSDDDADIRLHSDGTAVFDKNVKIGSSTLPVTDQDARLVVTQDDLPQSLGDKAESFRVKHGRHHLVTQLEKTGNGADWNDYTVGIQHIVDISTQELITFGNTGYRRAINFGEVADDGYRHYATVAENGIGVGTNSPSFPLHIVDEPGTVNIDGVTGYLGRFSRKIQDDHDGTTQEANILLEGLNTLGTLSSQSVISSFEHSTGNTSNTALQFRVRGSGGEYNNPDPVVTVLGDRRLGVGTTVPESLLHIVETDQSLASPALTVQSDNVVGRVMATKSSSASNSVNGFVIGTVNESSLSFQTNSQSCLFIDPDQRYYFNTTPTTRDANGPKYIFYGNHVYLTNKGPAQYWLYNGSGKCEWLMGQKRGGYAPSDTPGTGSYWTLTRKVGTTYTESITAFENGMQMGILSKIPKAALNVGQADGNVTTTLDGPGWYKVVTIGDGSFDWENDPRIDFRDDTPLVVGSSFRIINERFELTGGAQAAPIHNNGATIIESSIGNNNLISRISKTHFVSPQVLFLAEILPDSSVFRPFDGFNNPSTGFQVNKSLGREYNQSRTIGFLSLLDNSSEYDGGDTTNKNFNIVAVGTAPNIFVGDLIHTTNNDPYKTYDGTNFNCGFVANVLTINRNTKSSHAMMRFQNSTGTTDSVVTCGEVLIENNGTKFDAKDGQFIVNGTPKSGFFTVADARVMTSTTEFTNAAAIVKLLSPKREGFVAGQLAQHFSRAVEGDENATEDIGTVYNPDGSVYKENVTRDETDLIYSENVVDTPRLDNVPATFDENGNELTPEIPETPETYRLVERTRTWSKTGTQPKYQTVDQTKLIPLLTKALQEALTRIEALEAAAAGN